MKQDRMQKVRDSLCILLNHLLVLAAVMTVADLFQVENPNLFLWAGSMVIPLGLYLGIKKEPVLIPPVIFILLLGIMAMAESIMKIHDWNVYYYVIAFIYLFGYFFYYFVEKFLHFLRVNENTASNIPIADMFRNGMGQTAFFATCSSIILLGVVNIEWVKAIADTIWSGILLVLSYIFSGIKTEAPVEGKEEFGQKDPQLGGANMSEMIPQQTLEEIRDIMILLLCIAIVIGFIFFLYYVYWVIKDLEGKDRVKSKKGKLPEDEDVREYCGIEKNDQRKLGGFLFRSNREKVRRLYQKKIIKHKEALVGENAQGMLKYLTAKECCDKLSEQQLKQAYEKARYSEEVITAEDVRTAK